MTHQAKKQLPCGSGEALWLAPPRLKSLKGGWYPLEPLQTGPGKAAIDLELDPTSREETGTVLEDWKRKLGKKMQQVKRGVSAVYHKEEEPSPRKEESSGSVVGLD